MHDGEKYRACEVRVYEDDHGIQVVTEYTGTDHCLDLAKIEDVVAVRDACNAFIEKRKKTYGRFQGS